MKKGQVQIFLVILILMIGLALIVILALWLPNIAFEAYSEEAYEKSYLRSRACLSLESVDINSQDLIIKNCGLVPLRDFKVYIDFNEVASDNINILNPQESLTIYYGLSLPEGSYEFYVTADYAESPPKIVTV